MENTVVKVNEVSLPVKTWNNQLIVTLSDVDRVHQSSEGAARKNFNRNKIHFIENEDYFSITRKEFAERYSNNCVTNGHATLKMKGNPNVKMILLTESGYLMIAKSFQDDLAWEVQRKLVNSYFKLKEVHHSLSEELPVNMQSLYQTVLDLSNKFKSIENVFDEQFEEFKKAIQQLGSLTLPVKKDIPLEIEEITAADPIRDTIKPLAELYNDKSVGYNNTYRKVYALMDVDWKYRRSRYRNQKGMKNRPSKIHLLEEDKKLLDMFNATVNKLIAEFTEESINE